MAGEQPPKTIPEETIDLKNTETSVIMDKFLKDQETQKGLAKGAETDGGKQMGDNPVFIEEKKQAEEVKKQGLFAKIGGLFAKSEEKKTVELNALREKGMGLIMKHPAKKAFYNVIDTDFKKQKYAEAVGNKPTNMKFKWIEADQKYIDQSGGGAM